MFSNENKKNYVYPCKLQFYYIQVGFGVGGGGQNYIGMFSWCYESLVYIAIFNCREEAGSEGLRPGEGPSKHSLKIYSGPLSARQLPWRADNGPL